MRQRRRCRVARFTTPSPRADMRRRLDAIARRGRPPVASRGRRDVRLGLLRSRRRSAEGVPHRPCGMVAHAGGGSRAVPRHARIERRPRPRATIGSMISMTIAIFLVDAPFLAAPPSLLVAGWPAADASATRSGPSADRRHPARAHRARRAREHIVALLLLSRAVRPGLGHRGRRRQNRRHRLEHRRGPHNTTADASSAVVRELKLTGRRKPSRSRPSRSGRTRTGAAESRLDDRVHPHAVCDPHGPHAGRSHDVGLLSPGWLSWATWLWPC